MQIFINLPLRRLALSRFKQLCVLQKSLSQTSLTFKRCLQRGMGPHWENTTCTHGWSHPPQQEAEAELPCSRPSVMVCGRGSTGSGPALKGQSRAGHQWNPHGQAGEAAPQPRCTGCCARQEHRGSRTLQPGGLSCWPLLTGTEFTHLKLIRVSLYSPCSLWDYKASTLLVTCSYAKAVADPGCEVRSAGRCYLIL